MSNRTLNLTDPLYRYLLNVSLREPDVLKDLRAETAILPSANMQIAPEQGQFMALLVLMLNARRIIEVGVFTGYSSLVMAMALPADGQLIACDINQDYTDIARQYWQRADVAKKIDLRLAPGRETLRQLLDRGESGQFDLAFIDADKTGYLEYYELSLKLLRPGGLIVVDNVLWNGAVIDERIQDEDTAAIRAFNEMLKSDQRVDISLLPVADGLTLARKR